MALFAVPALLHPSAIGKFPSSPPWHRRQRAKRAKARRLIKKNRLENLGQLTQPVYRALKLLEAHHTAPVYRERMYQGWQKQNGMQWGAWSPQWPKKNPKSNKKKEKEEGAKDQQKASGVLRAYDAAQVGASLSSSSSSGSVGTQEAQFFKEFVNYVKENKCELPENLQRLMPNEDKENLREQQRKLNKQRNILNKINNKKKAIEQDNEQWGAWINSVKEEIQKQRSKHEESQRRLAKELDTLLAEEKKLAQNEELEMEVEAEQELEDLLDGAIQPAADGEQNAKLKEMQSRLEEQYQQRFMEERNRMQQHFSEQLLQFAAVTMDPYLQEVEGENGGFVEKNLREEPNSDAPKKILSPPGLIRNPVAPFGVQRPEKTTHTSSPYGQKEAKAMKQIMGSYMEQQDTGQS